MLSPAPLLVFLHRPNTLVDFGWPLAYWKMTQGDPRGAHHNSRLRRDTVIEGKRTPHCYWLLLLTLSMHVCDGRECSQCCAPVGHRFHRGLAGTASYLPKTKESKTNHLPDVTAGLDRRDSTLQLHTIRKRSPLQERSRTSGAVQAIASPFRHQNCPSRSD